MNFIGRFTGEKEKAVKHVGQFDFFTMLFSKKSKIDKILTKLMKPVESVIEKLLISYIDENHQELVKYQIKTGGKRLRPALVIISCRMLGGKLEDTLYPAAGLEILHNYTLIVDDIIDNSNLRRGKPTVWAKFGKSIAECIGMDYSVAIFQAVNRSKKPIKLSELFAKTMKAIVDGQILDILFERWGREEEDYIVKNRYFKMVSKKTAFLFQTCCQTGGICAGAKEKELQALRNYGFNLGLAFQIQDDILDIFGEEKKFGKKIGKDIMERKGGNIVILLALKKLNLAEKKKLLGILRKKKIDQKDIKKAVNLIKKTKSQQKVILLGEKCVERAKKALGQLPKNKWNDILKEVVDFVMERGN